MNDRVYVRGEGPLHAKLMIVGEAPAFYEVQEGGPFRGPSGRLLNKFLQNAGINRSECYLTNLVKIRAPGDKFARFREIGVNPVDWLPELWNEIRTIRPNCILALGANPLKFLTGRSGKGNSITQNRGSILRLVAEAGHECKVVPTFHPANLLHMQGSELDDPIAEQYMQLDFQRAAEESRTSDYNIPQRHIGVARNSMDTWRYLERHRHHKKIAVDIEVIYSIPILLGIAFSPEEALSIPLLDFDSPFHKGRLCASPRDVAQSLKAVYDVLADPSMEVRGQNFKFDHDKVEIRGCRINGRIVDIMLLHHTLYPELPKGLDFTTSVHTREPFYKIEGREFNFKKDRLEEYAKYNGKDACVTYEIADVLLPQLEEFGLTDFFFGYQKGNWRYPLGVMRFHDMYRKMEAVGFLYDKQVNNGLKIKYGLWRDRVQKQLDDLVGANVNVKSNPQMEYLLYQHFKLPKRAGASEDVLVALRNSPANKNEDAKKAIDYVLEIRRVRDTISRYIAAKPDFDGRMRTVFNIGGTKTGRTSTQQQKPPVRPIVMGMAFHTITKHGDIGPDIRKQYVADKGFVFIQADSAQAEARVVFLLAKNYEGLKRMDDPNYDIHAHTASWFYPGDTQQALRKDKPKRFTGKKIRHAGHYDMEKRRCMIEFNNDAKKFGIDAQISEWKAGKLLETFHENDPSIKQVFHAEVQEIIITEKVLVSPHGRRREFFGNADNNQFFKEAYSQLPQATVADNTKRAMLAIREEIQDIRYVLEWHDGFLALVPEKEVVEYGRVFVREMQAPIDFSECSLKRGELVIPCELEISETNFYDLKPYHLPE